MRHSSELPPDELRGRGGLRVAPRNVPPRYPPRTDGPARAGVPKASTKGHGRLPDRPTYAPDGPHAYVAPIAVRGDAAKFVAAYELQRTRRAAGGAGVPAPSAAGVRWDATYRKLSKAARLARGAPNS